jgi:hypothetical protein
MDSSMIGAIGEIVGAGGVIVTLGYLAKQVAQSNVAALHEARRETLDLNFRVMSQIATDPQLARLLRRGMMDDPDLNPDELSQLSALFMQMTTAWMRQFEFEGDIAFESQAAIRRQVVSTPGYRKWFSERQDWVDGVFREQIQRDMASTSTLPPIQQRLVDSPTSAGEERGQPGAM